MHLIYSDGIITSEVDKISQIVYFGDVDEAVFERDVVYVLVVLDEVFLLCLLFDID